MILICNFDFSIVRSGYRVEYEEVIYVNRGGFFCLGDMFFFNIFFVLVLIF